MQNEEVAPAIADAATVTPKLIEDLCADSAKQYASSEKPLPIPALTEPELKHPRSPQRSQRLQGKRYIGAADRRPVVDRKTGEVTDGREFLCSPPIGKVMRATDGTRYAHNRDNGGMVNLDKDRRSKKNRKRAKIDARGGRKSRRQRAVEQSERDLSRNERRREVETTLPATPEAAPRALPEAAEPAAVEAPAREVETTPQHRQSRDHATGESLDD
jgi:hypothetical protein